MLKGLTNTFKDNCNNIELTYKEYLVLNGVTIPIKADLDDDCYENGNFIGSFIFKQIKFETDAKYKFRNREFEYYKVVDGESIKIGTFITTEVSINDTTNIVSVVGMDYGLKTQIEYTSTLNYESGNITLLDVWNECCTLSGLQSGVTSFPNSNFIVDSDQFSGTGAMIRDVYKAIGLSSGTFIKVMNDDKVYPIFKTQTNDIIEDYVELEDKRDTHPWTCLRLGMSQIDGENLDYIDEDLVAQYGENWLILNDNPFAYNQEKRQELIENIYNQIKAFGYSAFESKTAFKPYLTCGDLIKFRNRQGQLVDSIVLRYHHNSEEIDISAPSETSATVNYIYPLSAVDIAKNTQVIVNKAEGGINLITEQLENNYYDTSKVNELIQNATTGLTNTFSTSGGSNIFRNTGLWFKDENDNYEFWEGNATRNSNDNAVNGNSIILQNGSFKQEQPVPNGRYTISFYYQVLNPLATASVKINDIEYSLNSEEPILFYTGQENTEGGYITQPLEVTTKSIKIEFICDIDGAVEVYDLMGNIGSTYLAYTQNGNETTTDTVNISKGITITSTNMETIFRANANGIRITTLQDSLIAYFTDKGLSTKELVVENEAQIVKVLFQEVDDQTWITRI